MWSSGDLQAGVSSLFRSFSFWSNFGSNSNYSNNDYHLETYKSEPPEFLSTVWRCACFSKQGTDSEKSGPCPGRSDGEYKCSEDRGVAQGDI